VITGYVVGDTEVIARLQALPARVQSSLVSKVTALALRLVNRVKSDKLSGQVLKRRTGTLSRSINDRVAETPNEVTGSVGTNVAYAAFHEYGYDGTEQVKQHLREIKQAFGREISPRSVTVSAHSRKVNYPARSFLRSALRDMDGEIRSGLAAALHEAIQR